MMIVEIIVALLLYPFTKAAMSLATMAAMRGDLEQATKWLSVWRWFHAPEEFCANEVNYHRRRKPTPLEKKLAEKLWRYTWYRELLGYFVAHSFPFKQRPWPSFIRNGTPYYAVEYYWFIYVAQDWASAQDVLRDADYCGWSIDRYKIHRGQWQAETENYEQ